MGVVAVAVLWSLLSPLHAQPNEPCEIILDPQEINQAVDSAVGSIRRKLAIEEQTKNVRGVVVRSFKGYLLDRLRKLPPVQRGTALSILARVQLQSEVHQGQESTAFRGVRINPRYLGQWDSSSRQIYLHPALKGQSFALAVLTHEAEKMLGTISRAPRFKTYLGIAVGRPEEEQVEERALKAEYEFLRDVIRNVEQLGDLADMIVDESEIPVPNRESMSWQLRRGSYGGRSAIEVWSTMRLPSSSVPERVNLDLNWQWLYFVHLPGELSSRSWLQFRRSPLSFHN